MAKNVGRAIFSVFLMVSLECIEHPHPQSVLVLSIRDGEIGLLSALPNTNAFDRVGRC